MYQSILFWHQNHFDTKSFLLKGGMFSFISITRFLLSDFCRLQPGAGIFLMAKLTKWVSIMKHMGIFQGTPSPKQKRKPQELRSY